MVAIKTQMGRFVKDSLLVDICFSLNGVDPITTEPTYPQSAPLLASA